MHYARPRHVPYDRASRQHRDLLYAGVVVWAFFGIYLKRSTSTEEGSAVVATAALVGIGLLVLGMVVTKIRARR
jgi:hypothetical protein